MEKYEKTQKTLDTKLMYVKIKVVYRYTYKTQMDITSNRKRSIV